MAYIAPIHRASSIRHALKLRFLDPEHECLVVAKANRLEIYSQTPDGLALAHTKAIYGKVTILNKIRPATSSTDQLFVGTDRFMYLTLSWDRESKQLKTEKSYVDLADKSARENQTGDRCLIDPSGKFMTLEFFEGMVTVVPILQGSRASGKKKAAVAVASTDAEIGSLGEPVPTRISEMFVRSSAFLQRRRPDLEQPKIALLYEDSQSKVRLKMRQLSWSQGASGEQGTAELEEVEGLTEELELGASHLIPISEPVYGVLILGETSISYFDDTDNRVHTKPLEEATIFVAWERVDSQRFVIADEYGKLYLLMLILDSSNGVKDWQLDVIGETSRASTLVYLDAGHIFVGSHQGDSQVIRIQERSMEVVQSFSNIAPILDFTIMDMGNRSGEGQSNEYSSGQARIVTGSGAFKDGSLRSVRSGVGLEELGVLGEMGHVSDMFSVSSNPATNLADTLIVSSINESRVFRFSEDGDVEEVDDFKGVVPSESTLLAQNVANGRLLVVTGTGASLVDMESGMEVSTWRSPNNPITAVAANDHSALLSLGGVQLIVLSLNDSLDEHASKTFTADSQIACVEIPSTLPDICIVGFWQGSAVSILDVKTLGTIQTVSISDDGLSVPRSLLLTNIFPDQPPTLFIATADGNVVTFSVEPTRFTLSDRQSIVLGTQQANLRALPRGDGLNSVFATCEHPSLIYGSEGRLIYSAVTAEKATCVCPFDSAAYPSAIVIATSEDVRIAVVDTERTTHVQTLLVNETVRRIAYSPALKAFGLGTTKRILRDGVEIIQSHFKLADEILFKELDTFALNEDELVESVMRAELDDGTGDLAERFVVGTAYLDDEAAGNVRGRILVLEVTNDRQLKLVTELAVKGACRCLGMCDGKIIAALTKTVAVYSFTYDTPSSPIMRKLATYRTSTAPIDLAIYDSPSDDEHIIAVADLMKSVSILTYKPSDTPAVGHVLKETARHFQTSWATACAQVEENDWLEADAEGNLMVLRRNTEGVTEEDKRRLEVTSEMCLGEMVNRIRRVDVSAQGDAAVLPRAFLATVEGALYLYATIQPNYLNLLISLQSALADKVISPGHVPFMKYRAFKNQVRESEEPHRFVDGELIEAFLGLDSETQEEIAVELGLEVSAERLKVLVESLKRLH
ncbi:hypothetical protein W97_00290 [Coniosporium apollinis CBS 100218]|uniref:DNA damage-binding protein 1 n=1 Tax=Coniosporium apollinis (strain CBS 100218) TaxID=1168221 RepID=R7YH13_CONA1|nr:uncharacterized protein W97_00290 [Coniosporium apollinis CBS 100218]EON61079.1 hypothetical protein W97_00290 [Coniosporium apollinis CBS 100218]